MWLEEISLEKSREVVKVNELSEEDEIRLFVEIKETELAKGKGVFIGIFFIMYVGKCFGRLVDEIEEVCWE